MKQFGAQVIYVQPIRNESPPLGAERRRGSAISRVRFTEKTGQRNWKFFAFDGLRIFQLWGIVGSQATVVFCRGRLQNGRGVIDDVER